MLTEFQGYIGDENTKADYGKDKIRLFIVCAKIIHGNLSLVCTLCNIKL